MDKEDLNTILGAGVKAPSGENCQPWRFVVEGMRIFIYNLPDRDRSPYNFRQYGSFVSHGAVIENIVIAASGLGYTSVVDLFPHAEEPDCTVVITFTKNDQVQKNELGESISLRASNRTSYDPMHTMSASDREYLLARATDTALPARLILVDDREKKKSIGNALSYGDRLLFENRAIHDFLFGHIYWTLDQANDKKDGFYVKELALTPPQEFTFKLLKKEGVRRFFVKVGLPSMAAKENAALYEHSSAIGAVVANGNTPKDFVEGGRLMERVWLAATKLGYDMQLITAIGFFNQRILGNETNDFSPEQIEGIKASYATLKKEFQIANETIVIMFRIGKGKPLPHRSLRMDPIVEFRA